MTYSFDSLWVAPKTSQHVGTFTVHVYSTYLSTGYRLVIDTFTVRIEEMEASSGAEDYEDPVVAKYAALTSDTQLQELLMDFQFEGLFIDRYFTPKDDGLRVEIASVTNTGLATLRFNKEM